MDSETNHRATKILAEVGGQDMAADAALVKGLVTDSAERMDEEENKEFVTIGWRYLGKADANLHESKHPTQIQLPFPSIVDSPPTLITSQSPVPADSFPSFPHPSPSPSTNLGSIKEIITIIADNLFLTNDDEALVIMGLVCKTWRNSVGIELKKAEKRLEKADDKQLDLFTPRQRRLLKHLVWSSDSATAIFHLIQDCVNLERLEHHNHVDNYHRFWSIHVPQFSNLRHLRIVTTNDFVWYNFPSPDTWPQLRCLEVSKDYHWDESWDCLCPDDNFGGSLVHDYRHIPVIALSSRLIEGEENPAVILQLEISVKSGTGVLENRTSLCKDVVANLRKSKGSSEKHIHHLRDGEDGILVRTGVYLSRITDDMRELHVELRGSSISPDILVTSSQMSSYLQENVEDCMRWFVERGTRTFGGVFAQYHESASKLEGLTLVCHVDSICHSGHQQVWLWECKRDQDGKFYTSRKEIDQWWFDNHKNGRCDGEKEEKKTGAEIVEVVDQEEDVFRSEAGESGIWTGN